MHDHHPNDMASARENKPSQRETGSTEPLKRSSPPLSPTEQKVYDLLLQRLTERQVAEQLDRSHNTVHVHVRNVYRKLGVRSRQELFELPYQEPVAKPHAQ